MYYELPTDPTKSKPIMQRFLQENLASSQSIWAGGRRRPLPVRAIQAAYASPNVTLLWQPPQNVAGIQGFNIYQDSEANKIANINNPNTLQFLVPVTEALPIAFYISCYTALLESIKMKVVAHS